MIIYFYDIKARIKDYNRIKRMFYYRLKKSKLSSYPSKTKSVILVDDAAEAMADMFFMRHKSHIICYKAYCAGIERLV